jgi:hypothetical protein
MKYKATRAFRIVKEVLAGELIELDATEAQRFAGSIETVEPAAVVPSTVNSAPDKKYKKGRTKNV